MLKIYVNSVNNVFYDVEGNQFSDGMPQIPYRNTERVAIQLCSKTPNSGTTAVDPENEWEKDIQFSDVEGVGAWLASDNNFIHRLKGVLAADLTSGPVDSIQLTMPEIESTVIATGGTLRIFNNRGEFEAVEYVSRYAEDDVVTFVLAEGASLNADHSAGAEADAEEALYLQSSMNADLSDPANGLFVFDVTANSEKLRSLVEYSDSANAPDVVGLELMIYSADPQTEEITTRKTFLCQTFSIPVPIAYPKF